MILRICMAMALVSSVGCGARSGWMPAPPAVTNLSASLRPQVPPFGYVGNQCQVELRFKVVNPATGTDVVYGHFPKDVCAFAEWIVSAQEAAEAAQQAAKP